MSRTTALIVGDASTLNRAIALALASDGRDIVLACHAPPNGAAELRAEIERTGASVRLVQAPLDAPETPERIVGEIADLALTVWSTGRPPAGRLIDTDAEELDRQYALHYRSAILFTKASANAMIETGTAGSILFVTSHHAHRAYADNVLIGSYSAALHRSAESLAMQLAPDRIRLNCIAAGETLPASPAGTEFGDQIPLGYGRDEDVADAAAFLCSERARYMTGTVLKVDGGLTLPGMPEHGRGSGWNRPLAAPGLSTAAQK
ncbi:SDR family NAD(P)-dependent oxidoreductase [Cohnella cellulosilytica]|uniref:SDR family NAD(P)-dependent oxidoreductase n=1 Tax=Cohnella cellulosilytica TaxID=986710 RepID=A0ABW2F7X2_9BACL